MAKIPEEGKMNNKQYHGIMKSLFQIESGVVCGALGIFCLFAVMESKHLWSDLAITGVLVIVMLRLYKLEYKETER